MYNLHYDYVKPKYLDKIKFCYMDTNSFIYDVKQNKHFDTSAYLKENAYNFPSMNKKIQVKMKTECNANVITEFIGLRAKMYSVKIDRIDEEIIKIIEIV